MIGDSSDVAQITVLFSSEIDPDSNYWIPGDELLTQWVEAALKESLQKSAGKANVEVSVSVVSREQMQSLNAQYRGKHAPTNVLSFPADMPVLHTETENASSLSVLGDIVLCPDVLTIEAKEQGKSIQDHWAHMLVHSVLHLNGMDHSSEITADTMESLEIRILSTLNISNPYLAVSAKQS